MLTCLLLQLDEIEEALEEDGRRGKKGKTKQKAKGPQALTHEQKIEVAVAGEMTAASHD